jgi:hypothetical protein
MPLINTSAFSNTLGAPYHTAQRKALVTPFTEFDGKPEEIVQYIARFTQRCKETGVVEDFNFIIKENNPPSSVDLSDPVKKAAWLSDPDRFVYGNLLQDASKATFENVIAARTSVRNSVNQLTATPDPKKMPLTSQKLVSYQNRDWMYVLLMSVWSLTMQAIMDRYQETHEQDGVMLWFCFLQEFAGTTTANVIQANAMLLDTKLQMNNFNNNILSFTNYVRAPIRSLLKAREPPSRQHFISVFHSCLDIPNVEFQTFVTALYSDYRSDGPTKQLTMLQLLDKFDIEYKRLETLGRWEKKKDPEILALTATISNLQAQLSTVKTQYAMIAKLRQPSNTTPTGTPSTKLQKPPPRQAGTPEIIEFQGFTWKWCDKCFNGSWNRTHVTSEHVAGIGKKNRGHQPAPGQQNVLANIASITPSNDSSNIVSPATSQEPQESNTMSTTLQSSVTPIPSSTLDFFYD